MSLRAIEHARLLGRYREGLAMVGAHETAATHARVGDMLLGRGDASGAVVHLRRAVALEPRSLRARIALAEALGLAEAWNDAIATLRSAVARAPRSLVDAAARLALRLGAFDDAKAMAERAGTSDVLAHLALFAGDPRSATRHLAPAPHADRCQHLTLHGIARALSSDDAGAIADFDAAIAMQHDAWEARAWRGELLSRAGQHDRALADLDDAIERAPGWLPGARVARLLTSIRAGAQSGREQIGHSAVAEIAATVTALVPEAPRDIASSTPDAAAEYLAKALLAMRGNRTLSPSFVDGGRLVPLRAPAGPRFASRHLLNLVATRDPDQLAGDFDRLIALHPHSGLPRCHRGEMWLWVGRYDRAREDLERVVAEFPVTRWAYIGLAVLELVEHRPERAIESLAHGVARMGSTGPAVFGVRGEAWRRLGRVEAARADLETALRVSPRRVSATVNLALVHMDAGDRDEATRTFDRLRDRAYPLLFDAANACGASIDDDGIDRRAVLERALAIMLGNRSSSLVTWSVEGSPLRCLVEGNVTADLVRAAVGSSKTETTGPTATRSPPSAPRR